MSSCQDCLIENNTIVQGQSAFYSNGIVADNRSRGAGDGISSNVVIKGNSFTMNGKNNSRAVNLNVSGSVINNTGTNNAGLDSTGKPYTMTCVSTSQTNTNNNCG